MARASNVVPPRVFVVTIGERAIAAFMAVDRSEAQELCREFRFREDLAELKDKNGQPIWDCQTSLQVRPGRSEEILQYTAALAQAKRTGETHEDLFVSFLRF